MPDTSPKHGLRLASALLKVEGLALMGFGAVSLAYPAPIQDYLGFDKTTAMTFAGVIAFAGLTSFMVGRIIMRGRERV